MKWIILIVSVYAIVFSLAFFCPRGHYFALINLYSVAVLELLIIRHDLHQKMQFAQLSWNYRCSNFRFFLSTLQTSHPFWHKSWGSQFILDLGNSTQVPFSSCSGAYDYITGSLRVVKMTSLFSCTQSSDWLSHYSNQGNSITRPVPVQAMWKWLPLFSSAHKSTHGACANFNRQLVVTANKISHVPAST